VSPGQVGSPTTPAAAALVSARGLEKHFYIRRSFFAKAVGGERDLRIRAVDGVDLDIRPGETLGLVGESGCGKSTLGRTLLYLYRPTGGRVLFEGRDVAGGPRELSALRRKAQIVFQNPFSSLNPRKTVRQILSAALSARGITSRAARERAVRSLLERVGLSARHADSYPHQFSGGQRQRIGIARALAVRPRFIVADEPVSSLDVSIQAQIINLLQDLQVEFGLTYLFIAHDLSVVYHVSDRVAVMYVGKVVELAPSAELFSDPLHPYTLALLSAVPTVSREGRPERVRLEGGVPSPAKPPPGCRFHPRCPMRLAKCAVEEPALRQVGRWHQVACHRA